MNDTKYVINISELSQKTLHFDLDTSSTEAQRREA
jgi:hypothetical protein